MSTPDPVSWKVVEREAEGVQHGPRGRAGVVPVASIAEDGKAGLREVDADLVLASGARTGLDEQAAGRDLEPREVRERGTRAAFFGSISSDRPFRAPGSPVVPAVFIALAVLLIANTIWTPPRPSALPAEAWMMGRRMTKPSTPPASITPATRGPMR